jgi:kynurenine formamidase
MCDHAGHGRTGWQGWIELPRSVVSASGGQWLDLSHPLHPGMPNASIFPPPRFEKIKSMPGDPMNVTEMRMAVHCGTHVDAPCHFFQDGPDFAAIPLDRLMGAGTVLAIPGEPGLRIDAAMLEACGGHVRPGDIVALHTGWAAFAGTPRYAHHPWLTEDAAWWLIERRIKLLACDTPSADLPIPDREAGFDWPAHRVLLARGILISEHLTGHAPLAGKRAEFIFNALAIRGSDGAPARVLARETAE